MSRVQIPINGISTTSSYKDGDVLAISNLRKKNGALKPVPPRLIVETLRQKYEYLFIHDLPSGAADNYIGVRSNEVFYITNPGEETEAEEKLCDVSGFISISQIGNVLNILDANGLQYVIWYESEYKLINTNFDGAQTATELLPVKVDLKVSRKGTATERDVAMYYSEGYHHGANNYDLNSTEAITQNGVAKGLFSKALKLESEKGNLNGFVLACTAIELFDGSYILHSNPVLLGQSLDAYTRYEDDFNYITNKATFVDTALVDETATITGGVGQSLATPATFTNDTDNKCYTGESNKQYRGTANQGTGGLTLDAAEHEAPNLYAQLVQSENTGSSYIYATISGNELQFKVNSNIPETLKPLIKSVSVFISPEISIYKTETCKFIGACYFGYYGSIRYKSYNWQPEIKTNAELLKELADNQQFYKVHEIPFDDIRTTTDNDGWVTVNLKGKLGDNLVNQEVLPVDNSTHHSLIPQKQYIYNSRLHIMDYKTVLSRGWPANYFFAQTDAVGQFAPQTFITHNSTEELHYAEVLIKTDNGVSKVLRYTEDYLPFIGYAPFISYPDSRATQITLYSFMKSVIDDNIKLYDKQVLKLTPSENQNYAYYINPELKPFGGIPNTAGEKEILPTETQREQVYRNGMKASALNNPFTFPAINTYQIGTGIIRWARTNAKQVSEGQFGQYPLFIGTTERVYALSVGSGEVLYQTQTPANNIAPISDIACQTAFGIVFVGKRGLYLLNSPEPTFIGAVLEQYPISLNFKNHEPTQATPFSELVISNILYDAHDNEIIIVNQGDNLVFNLDSKEFYTTTERIDQVVENVYPDLLVMQENADEVTEIKDFSQESDSSQEISFATRPFNFATQDKKRLERLILRARLHDSNNISAIAFASSDGVNFEPIMGKNYQNGNRRDIDLFLPNKKKYFIFSFQGTVSKESEISMLEAEVNQDTNSSKMR